MFTTSAERRLDAQVEKRLALTRSKPKVVSLAATMALEHFTAILAHELAHVATMDVWNKRDAFWRKLFRGKPMPIQEHPESMLYNYLATPRNSVPRWYLEGSAVFFETWMAGGLGRAQGAYDEMVFRAKVRDGDKFYSPLGLESEGTAVDFQVGVNDYLYGTRFFSYLALTYGPAKVLAWLKRGEGSAGYYSTQFRRVFGRPMDDVWDEWIAFEKGFQKDNLARLGKYPLTETQKLSPRGLGSISRGFVDPKTGRLVAAFRYPGRIGFVGTLDLASGQLRPLQEIKGMMLYKVTSLAFDADNLLLLPMLFGEHDRNLVRIEQHQSGDAPLRRGRSAAAVERADGQRGGGDEPGQDGQFALHDDSLNGRHMAGP